jgi:hypothetical protein
MGKRLGHFDVTLNQDSTSFSGLMHSAPDNETVSYDVVSKDGDCELRTPKVFTCDPVCSADQDCTTDRQCAPRPETASVGTLTVDGIQKRDQTAHFTLEPLNATTNRYNVAGLGAPAFAAGDVLTLSAQGGALEPFTISVVGIDVLMAKSVDPIPFEPGKPAEVTWVAGDPKLGQIVLTVDVGHHGGSQAEIVCNVEDTGSAQIAGSLVTGLTDLGVAGFPLVTVERRTANYANLSAGYAEFTLSSPLTLSLAIPGVQSCNTDADCENGQTCKMPNLQCVDP